MEYTALKVAMIETLFELCNEDATDSAAYIYAYDRLIDKLKEKDAEFDNEGFFES